MAKRPDLDALIVPKGSELPSITSSIEGGPKSYAHTLSLRLTVEQYRRLRRFVAGMEEKGRRTTQQAVIEAALDEYLTKAGG